MQMHLRFMGLLDRRLELSTLDSKVEALFAIRQKISIWLAR